MGLFFLLLGLSLLALVVLGVPFLRRQNETSNAVAHDLEIYRDQLTELKRDVERGVILPEEEEAARIEIERRILALNNSDADSPASSSQIMTMIMIGVLGLIPMAAGGVYLLQGSPEMPAKPFAEREQVQTIPAENAEGMHDQMTGMIASLSQRLQEDPSDLEGWALLARSLVQVQRYDEAITAYREANRLAGGRDRQLAAEYAETLVIANDGIVSPEPRQIFETFLAENADDPQAIYYLALAKAQEGREQEALADWQRLLEISPPNAPWVGAVRDQITQLTGREPQATEERFVGPTADQVEAITALPADQQNSMIEGMVAGLAARLEENPDDLDGWRRLARSYTVLGRQEEARAAYEQILRLAPNDADARAALGR
jgi:cytochrome c-type biogenesis protein CcmH